MIRLILILKLTWPVQRTSSDLFREFQGMSHLCNTYPFLLMLLRLLDNVNQQLNSFLGIVLEKPQKSSFTKEFSSHFPLSNKFRWWMKWMKVLLLIFFFFEICHIVKFIANGKSHRPGTWAVFPHDMTNAVKHTHTMTAVVSSQSTFIELVSKAHPV